MVVASFVDLVGSHYCLEIRRYSHQWRYDFYSPLALVALVESNVLMVMVNRKSAALSLSLSLSPVFQNSKTTKKNNCEG
jgi:hypothetical protein